MMIHGEGATAGPLSHRYEVMRIDREERLRQARACAALTIPSLYPPEGHNPNDTLPMPYTSLGADAVRSLSTRCLNALFPAGSLFVRRDLAPLVVQNYRQQVVMQIAPQYPDDELETLEERAEPLVAQWVTKRRMELTAQEEVIRQEIETNGHRIGQQLVIEHVLLAGSAAYWLHKDKSLTCYGLDKFVCRMDSKCQPIEVIIQEYLTAEEVVEQLGVEFLRECDQELYKENKSLLKGSLVGGKVAPKGYVLHTQQLRVDGYAVVRQEINGKHVEKADSKVPYKARPINVVPMYDTQGGNYSRSYVHDQYPGLDECNVYAFAARKHARKSGINVTAVSPESGVTPQEIDEIQDDRAVAADPDKIKSLSLTGGQLDLKTLLQFYMEMGRKVQEAFLMDEAIQSQTAGRERVTAYEIDTSVKRLDARTGGLYVSLSQNWQVHYAERMIYLLEKEGALPYVKDGLTDLVLTTGLEAIQKAMEIEKIQAVLSGLSSHPQGLQIVDVFELSDRLGNALNYPVKGLIKTRQQFQDEQEQALQANMLDKATPNMVNAGKDLLLAQAAQNQTSSTSTEQQAPAAPGGLSPELLSVMQELGIDPAELAAGDIQALAGDPSAMLPQ